MKKQKLMTLTCLALVLMIACVGTMAMAQASGKASRLGLVNNPTPPGETPLMVDPQEDAEVLFTYHNGTPVTIYDDYDNGYSRVQIGNIGGYIKTEMLLDEFPDAVPFELPVVEVSNIGADDVVNFREMPMKESTNVDQVKLGQSFLVLGEGEDWYHVVNGDQMGFVDPEFLLQTEKTEVYAINTDGTRAK